MQREETLERRAEMLDKREHQISSTQGQIQKKEQDLDDAIAEEKAAPRVARRHDRRRGQGRPHAPHRGGRQARRRRATSASRSPCAREEADKRARNIVGIAIQRVAADHTAESTVSVVHLPERRHEGPHHRPRGPQHPRLRAGDRHQPHHRRHPRGGHPLELRPGAPRDRAASRSRRLIADGRIHPARIEELHKKAETLVEQQIHEAGEQAVFETGVHGLHAELVRTLGRLKFRTSYGQNVLKHSLEVSYLAGVMAAELGVDVKLAKRAGLLHDLGKAIDHEVEGPHARHRRRARQAPRREQGDRPLRSRRTTATPRPTTVEAVLVQAADAISAARPGARRETLESYIKRLEKLEAIAESYKGVEKSYAMQAGREIRVMVKPEQISDADAVVLARDIAKQIEEEMEYPGQIKVIVIRESRAVEYAK